MRIGKIIRWSTMLGVLLGLGVLTAPDANAQQTRGAKLGRLDCTADQIAKFDGVQWVCASDVDTDTNTNAATECAADEVLLGDAGGCVNITELLDFLDSLDTKTVFATSTVHTGNLGGLQGADFICNQRAHEAGLFGTYKAWLSDSTGSPSTRFIRSPVPYVRTDGAEVAADWTDLTDAALAIPILLSETGGAPGAGLAWTSTSATGDGLLSPLHCSNWTSGSAAVTGVSGDVSQTNEFWTLFAFSLCNQSFSLYCFEQ